MGRQKRGGAVREVVIEPAYAKLWSYKAVVVKGTY